MSRYKMTQVKYDKVNNIIKFAIKSTEVLPSFLYYLLQYHKLPITAQLQFTDKTVRLVKKDDDYIYERI